MSDLFSLHDLARILIGGAILGATKVAWGQARPLLLPALDRADPRLQPLLRNLFIWLWVPGSLVTYYFLTLDVGSSALKWGSLVVLAWSFLLVFYLQKRDQKFRSVGIFGADQTVKQGLDYGKSLSLCRNQLRFLGIGASKLTGDKGSFEAAVKRCSNNRPIQLLLCRPTNDALVEAAKRFGRPEDEYRKIVLNSLRTIAELKTKYSNIEVRFYERFQIFRMMFIDDSLCLLSYNLTGEGDGSQLPQIHICKPPETKRIVNSLYYPLQRYFEDTWSIAHPWDFKEYLDGNV